MQNSMQTVFSSEWCSPSVQFQINKVNNWTIKDDTYTLRKKAHIINTDNEHSPPPPPPPLILKQ